jgi:hypothetical protein
MKENNRQHEEEKLRTEESWKQQLWKFWNEENQSAAIIWRNSGENRSEENRIFRWRRRVMKKEEKMKIWKCLWRKSWRERRRKYYNIKAEEEEENYKYPVENEMHRKKWRRRKYNEENIMTWKSSLKPLWRRRRKYCGLLAEAAKNGEIWRAASKARRRATGGRKRRTRREKRGGR